MAHFQTFTHVGSHPEASLSRGEKPGNETPDLREAHVLGAYLRHDSLPIAGIAVALLLGTYVLLGLPVDGGLLAVAACGTFAVYQYDRAAGHSPEDRVNQPERVAWMQAHRTYALGSVALAGLTTCALLPLLRPATLAWGGVLGGLALLHVAGGNKVGQWGRLKPVVISGVWALGGVVLPVVEAGAALSPTVVLLAGYRWLGILPNTLLADAADRAGDAAVGHRTVGTTWPVPRVQGGAALSIAGALLGAAVLAGRIPPALLAVDAAGLALMAAGVARWRHLPTRWRRLGLDLAVAWPGLTWGAALLGA
jgi:hypothetical protein